MGTTCILQSHRAPLPAAWYERCLRSVQAWAEASGFGYRFLDDRIFDFLADDLRVRTADRLMVRSDLARLHWCRAVLAEPGVERVVWLDADVWVRDPSALLLEKTSFQVGREVWVDRVDGQPKAWRHVHNAFLQFGTGNAVLEFYLTAAESMVRRHAGVMVPQFVGPKLLTALHNIVGFDVQEQVGMISPALGEDLLAGGGTCLDLFRQRSPVFPAAFNLAGSLAPEHDEDWFDRLIDHLADERTF